ncbi:tRNA-modifying protein YgfZ [Candidatus Rickettsiella viridis]|uniref:tRNA-modifying protein YgfZ n=1 Tax=Candidatus Rickettsiella viridis TaxID=676208 RepID=A0A2Z5V319_9COXI|nr:folate-binding protein YgfZ [Candidatus Rickettsiella viridis]BBB14872.1 tRNA-modifying protein YgfZ [Candidatus Rickettsiella viridis]
MVKTTTKNGKIDLTDFGIIQVSGKKAKLFLQGQLTCNVEEVDENQTRLGAHCDAKGRIQATLRLFFYQDAYYFLLPRTMLSHLLQCLKKYAVFSAVNLTDVTQHWKIIGLIGDSSAELLRQHTLFPEQTNSLSASASLICLAIPGSTPRFILLTPDEKSAFFIHTVEELPLSDWYLRDIIAGIPSIYPETIAQFTPHQLNYPAIGGVSFNKGCYIGQEIIARTHYLGQSKSRLYRVAFQANHQFPPGTAIQNEQGVRQGTLIMSANTEKDGYQALVCLQSQAISHTIHLESSQGPALQLLELPIILQE